MRLLVLALLTVLLALQPQRAIAHASLVASTPDDGALIRTVPDTVELVFNEPVEALSLMLVDPLGNAVRLDGGSGASEKIRARVPAGLGRGTHLISWRVVSADGHPVGGSLVFSVGQAGGSAESAAAAAASAPVTATNPWPLIVARWAMLAGLAVGVGGAAFLALLRRGTRGGFTSVAPIVAALAVGGAGAVALIGLEGLEAHGLPLTSLGQSLTWRTGWRAGQGTTAALALLAMAFAAGSLVLATMRAGKVWAVSAVLAAAVALAVSGHASTAPPRWLMPGVVAIHVAAVLMWAGALVPLAAAAIGGREVTGLAAFSRFALALFATIVVSGSILTLAQAVSPAALTASAYGEVLLVKLALVAAVIAIAALNRFGLTPAALAGDSAFRTALGRTIAIEAVIAIGILALVATWRTTPPPRALAAMREAKFQIHMHGTEAMASVVIQPAHSGPVKVSIEPKTLDLAPLRVQEVAISLTGEAEGSEPLRRPARPGGTDRWEVDGLTIPAPGKWRLRIDLLINDFEKTTLDAVIVVR